MELEQAAPFKTVGEVLAAIVRQQVDDFKKRKQEAQLLRILTERDLEDGREAGRIASGVRERDERAPEIEDAIEAAELAFEDGFYYIFVNDVQVERLNHAVDSQESIDVLFVRLTPLAGG
jgi:hypothetical protein